jgi:hypothetical protein
MAIIPLTGENFAQSSIRLHPSRSFTSSTGSFLGGETGTRRTGSVYVFAERSHCVYNVDRRYETGAISFDANTYLSAYDTITTVAAAETWNDEGVAQNNLITYLGGLYDPDPAHPSFTSVGPAGSNSDLNGGHFAMRLADFWGLGQQREESKVKITRITQPFELTTGSVMKNIVRKQLQTHYRGAFRSAHWSFTNYSCLNFFTASLGTGYANVDTDGIGGPDTPYVIVADANILPTASALVYPNQRQAHDRRDGVHAGREYTTDNLRGEWQYTPSGSFTAEFYINPRYTNDPGKEFMAGTIMHLSSTLAISLVSGSSTDGSGLVDGYRIMLQLSRSADIPPSILDLQTDNNERRAGHPIVGDVNWGAGNGVMTNSDLVFLTSDNSLKRNHWHHVAIRWGGRQTNAGTGSIYIDGTADSYFVVPSQSIGTPLAAGTGSDALVIGNFWEGSAEGNNHASNPSGFAQAQRSLFTYAVAAASDEYTADRPDGMHDKYGCTPWGPQEYTDTGIAVQMRHPLNAELHEIKLWKSFRTITQIQSSSRGTTLPGENAGLVFYVPPFFATNCALPMQESLRYTHASNWAYEGATRPEFPINQDVAFRLGGHLVNLESYVHDFAGNVQPLCLYLSQSIVKNIAYEVTSASFWTANQALYSEVGLVKRNLTILPCDNGIFKPDFTMLATGSSDETSPTPLTNGEWRYTDDFGTRDYSVVSLLNAATSSYLNLSSSRDKFGDFPAAYTTLVCADSSSFVDPDAVNTFLTAFYGTTTTGDEYGTSVFTTLAERLGDMSYTPTFFNISNLFYGKRILPNTLSIFDNELTGSGGKIKIKLKDNGQGSLYRADCKTAHATWSSVGTVFYDEGIAVIKSPNLPSFGEQQFNVNLKGEQDVHALETNILVQQGQLNSSSNPQYYPMTASDYVSEYDEDFVYITGINLHDNNLNIVAKASFAQPIVKRPSEKFLFRIKIDF